MAQQEYVLNGPKTFFFPFSIRQASQVSLQVNPGGTVVPVADYTVEGAAPGSIAVNVTWPDAPVDGTQTLVISRVLEIERQTDFVDSAAVPARALNIEFDHLYQVIQDFPEAARIEQFGAVGDGVTDDSAAFLASRALNQPIELQPDKTYAIGAQIAADADNQGFFSRSGKAGILILTGVGQFDRSDYTGTRFDANAMPFLCEGFDNYTFRNIHMQLQTGNGVRTVGALSVRDSRGADVDVEVSAFTEPQNGVVNIDSVIDSRFRINGHDIGTADDTLATMQVTVCDIDNNRIDDVPTTFTTVDAYGKNVLLSGAALTKYGQQTDGVNISGAGRECHGLRIAARFQTIGQAFDCFASYVQAHVQADDVQATGGSAVKLIHGARYNVVKCICGTTGGPAVVIAGSDQGFQTTAYNRVECIIAGVGDASGGGQGTAVQVFGSAATIFKPEYNYVSATVSNTASLNILADFEVGNNNVVEYINDSVNTGRVVRFGVDAGPGNRAIDRNKPQGGYRDGRWSNGRVLDLASTTPVAIAADTLYAVPYIIDEETTFGQIGIRVATAAVGSMRVGIYEWAQDGNPRDLVVDIGLINIGGMGGQLLNINPDGITLAAGRYILALASDAAPSLYSTPATNQAVVDFMGATGFGVDPLARMTAPFTFGALPASFPGVTFDSGGIPNIALRTGA